jgi:hypothetical protein
MQIRITKADGSTEAYFHTKVLGSLHRAMAAVRSDSLETAQMLSDSVTYFLYGKFKGETLTTDQIHQMILTVLEGAGFIRAGEALSAHRLNRQLQRRRVCVVDSEWPAWNKALVVKDLVEHYQVDKALARAIAGSVEEKILRMGAAHIRKGLVRHLVMSDMEDLLEAHHELSATEQMCTAL